MLSDLLFTFVAIAAVALFELAAVRYGADSRRLDPEAPARRAI